MEKNYCVSLLKFYVAGCLFYVPATFAQTQMAIWDFATVTSASTNTFNATTHTLYTTPTIQQFNQSIDNNGVTGTSYTDFIGAFHSASNAISWNDITGSGTDAELVLTLNTTGWNNIFLRFDYKSESANSFDIEYSTNGGSSWTQIINNTSITSDGFIAWSTKLLNFSTYTILNNQSNLKIKIQDLDNTGNDKFAFDNIEFYSAGTTTTSPGSPSIDLYASTTDFLSLNPTSGKASGVISDVTDPCRTKGITFLLKDSNTALNTLTVSALSSNTGVVFNANLAFTYINDSLRNLKITPTGVGYSTITVKVSDGTINDTYVINYAASAAADNIPNTNFHTGISDASTAIDVGNNYFLSGDDESNAIHLYHKDSSGYFFNTTNIAGPMGISGEGDFEASCRKGNKAYWMGSLGNSKNGNIQTSRHYFFATTIVGTGSLTTASYLGSQSLRASMTSWGDASGYNFTASGASGMIPKQIGGLNIEGLCLGPNDTSLYIGFRAPLVPVSNRTKALICPVKNFEAWFNNGSPIGTPQYGTPIELNLNGRGIRSLEKNANGQYLIVAGSYDSNLNAALYEWNGSAGSAPVLLTADLTGLNPEGIVSFPSPFYNGSSVELMSDDGTQQWYNDGLENKVLSNVEHKKFRTVIVPTTGGTLMPCTQSSLTSVAASQPTICTGNNSVINITGSLNGAAAWNIYTGSCGTTNLTSTTGNTISVTPTATTTYYIRGEGGCVTPGTCSAVTVLVNGCTGVEQIDLKNNFEVYPNPANGIINVEGNGVETYNVSIYNAMGQHILSHYSQSAVATIYITNLTSGMYYVKIFTDKGVAIKKIVKN